jgi:signal transduction histidine kinase
MGHVPNTVLIVEDDADARANLEDILELDGYAAESAGTFAELLGRREWDNLLAIILDRRLPDGTADEFLPELRGRAPNVPVIIITGFADVEGAIAALRQGALDYIVKPIDAETFRARLARVAENRQIKEELKAAQQQVLQSERLAAIGQMMAGLAHESRNALQRSQACLEMLAVEIHDRPAALNLVARIQKAQDDLYQLYEEVRDYAAPLRLTRAENDARLVLEQAWDHLGALRSGRDARLECLPDGKPARCCVDAFSLEQVFRNILENSLAAASDPVRISAEFQERRLDDQPGGDSHVRISIADNGPGLSPEARQKIFEPFFTTKTKGTGLGMAISQRIVEAHGGEIAVGREQPGAEIVITLPRK